ncbi:thioredoxin-like protein 4B isoform X2 [Dysidea avara]|uniref:thioredoxin-like protein 4B isoform X2 n=1 Tax=Dysidea avara TaxID=196820 RepID=UPI00331FBF1C
MSYQLRKLTTKKQVDSAIRDTEDKVLLLRFGKENDPVTMQLDNTLTKNEHLLSKMADMYSVDTDDVPVYTQYFDITITPATIFFFNGQHIKVDWGTADHTKFIGSFRSSQDLIDVVEVVYRGAMKGKLMVTSPLEHGSVTQYSLLYKDI